MRLNASTRKRAVQPLPGAARLPLRIRLGAWFLILGGAASVVNMTITALRGSVLPDLGVLGLGLGAALLYRLPLARVAASVSFGLLAVAFLVAAFWTSAGPEPLYVSFLGQSLGDGGALPWIAASGLTAFSSWQAWLLSRSPAREALDGAWD